MRLSPATEGRLPADVTRPGFRPEAHDIGQVHLGIGAFHRAHQAVCTDSALAAGGGNWRILGVSLRSADVRDQLAPQQGRYLVAERSPSGEQLRLVGAVAGVLVAPEDPAAVLAALADPAVRIVTLTITEKGYCHDPAAGTLDPDHPGIRHDLLDPARPQTAPGFLVEALARRRAAGVPAPVLLSCDNLANNGATLKAVLVALAEARGDAGLARHIAEAVACPATMVDRIVPATSPADLAATAERTRLEDHGLVVTEPFSQWVIERFDGPRPAWEAAGVLLVPEVHPYELAKLRLLNGSHSSIAYLGQLAGWAHVHEAVADPGLAGFLAALMDEAEATLDPVPGLDLGTYRADLMARFANAKLLHRTAQIAMDGSQKLPQRLVATARARLRAGQPIPAVATAIGAWLAYLIGVARDGRLPDDPLASTLTARAAEADPVASLLALEPVFGDLGGHPAFAGPVGAATKALLAHGAPAVLSTFAPGQAA